MKNGQCYIVTKFCLSRTFVCNEKDSAFIVQNLQREPRTRSKLASQSGYVRIIYISGEPQKKMNYDSEMFLLIMNAMRLGRVSVGKDAG